MILKMKTRALDMKEILNKIKEYINNEPLPIKMIPLANKIGLSVKLEHLPEEVSGYLIKENDGKFCITINSQHHQNRQRFTAAHEIGHYILHNHLIGNGIEDNKVFRAHSGQILNPSITQKHETEANRFAASILMPRDRLITTYKKLGEHPSEDKLTQLSRQWGVSLEALKIRLKTITKK